MMLDARTPYDIASDPTTDPDVLAVLSNHTDMDVRHAVAFNPNTPVYILNILSNSDDIDIMNAVMRNRSCPKDLYETTREMYIRKVNDTIHMNIRYVFAPFVPLTSMKISFSPEGIVSVKPDEMIYIKRDIPSDDDK